MNPIEERLTRVIAEVAGENPDIASFADEIAGKSGINGLTADDVRKGVTPKGIAMAWLMRKMMGATAATREDKSKETAHEAFPLLPFSQLVYDAMKEMPEGDAWQFPTLLKMDASVDMDRFTAAVNKALRNHPALLTTIEEVDGRALQKYTPERFGEVKFGKPFETPYYTIHIYEEDGEGYYLFRMNRILGDSVANINFHLDIIRAYFGEALPADDYYGYLKSHTARMASPQMSIHANWLQHTFGNNDYPVHPTPDMAPHEEEIPMEGRFTTDLSSLQEAMTALQEKEHVSRYELICLATALAIADYCGTESAALTWAYLGRETAGEQTVFGSLHRDIPLKIDKAASARALISQVKDRMYEGIVHSEYPYTLMAPQNEVWNYAVNVIEEPDILGVIADSPIPCSLVVDDDDAPRMAYTMLDVEIHEEDGLSLQLKFSASHYRQSSMRRFARLILRNIEWLLGRHQDITNELKGLLEGDSELHRLMEKSIATAAENNHDRRTNPVRGIEELYCFLDRFVTGMPWEALQLADRYGLFRQIDQSTGYFLYLFDQPIEELKDRGWFYHCLQYHPAIAQWIKHFNRQWAEHLQGNGSWCEDYLQMAESDELFGLGNGWYETPDNWHCWNDFFARRLASAEARPVAEAAMVAPADGIMQRWLDIDGEGRLVIPESIPLKTSRIGSVQELMADSPYRDAFTGGRFTHITLDMQDYHRVHAPVEGEIVDIRRVEGISGGGGIVIWNEELDRYTYASPDELGFQMLETRGIVVIRTKDMGMVAVIPVGMAQVGSVNWSRISIGDRVRKGDELGYFLFGGSDVTILVEKENAVKPLDDVTEKHILMGTGIARIS